jgi:GH35 family endo-1,4-beta-xylanase
VRRDALFLTLAIGSACSAQASPNSSPSAGAQAPAVAQPTSGGRQLKLGAAVQRARLVDPADPAYATTFAGAFDSLTPELELKLDHLLPKPGAYDWTAADDLLAYAEAHGKEMRGHALVWHRALPPWMTSRTWTPDELLAFLEAHVAATMGRYKGRIAEWDVVNEAFNDDGSWRSSLWYDVLGPGYVEAAFRFAREADPSAKLYYNDYGAEWANAKSDAILALATRLKQAGLLDGVGFQAHFNAGWYASETDLAANMARFAAAGLEIGITELDVAMSSETGTAEERLRDEARIYGGVAAACRAQPACKRLTVWGVTDRYTWLAPADVPLLFDAGYAPKPAYAAVRAALSAAR